MRMLEFKEKNIIHLLIIFDWLFSIGFIMWTIERERCGQGQFIFKELFKTCFVVTNLVIIISPIKNSPIPIKNFPFNALKN